ncbi:hypothetical protein OAT18_00400 [Tenacibaculum sp.]|nr:hypothetical protein [Tenacibaculum sp.]
MLLKTEKYIDIIEVSKILIDEKLIKFVKIYNGYMCTGTHIFLLATSKNQNSKKMNLNKTDKLEIFENAISWIIVLAMFIYGGAKLVQFDGAAEIDKTVSELTGMELMWAFYGYSKSFAITLGIFEIIGGILILIKKTRIIGCLFTSTILVNVIFQDIYFGVHLGALKAAILYQILILIILWLNKEKLIRSLKTLLESNKIEHPKTKLFIKLLIAFGIFVVLRILEYYVTIKW